MKELYKNPLLYYAAVPVILLFWPILIWALYQPNAENNLKTDRDKYAKAEKVMLEILRLDPDRRDYANTKNPSSEFDYVAAVDSIARSCGIASSDYNISAKPSRTTDGQKSQNANVILKQVEMSKFAEFLSTIQMRWANLQCEKIKLTKIKGQPDQWKIDIEFKYYF